MLINCQTSRLIMTTSAAIVKLVLNTWSPEITRPLAFRVVISMGTSWEFAQMHSLEVLLMLNYVVTFLEMLHSLFIKFYYNQATTNLAFHSNETSKDKKSII